jgi:hypothetical protein
MSRNLYHAPSCHIMPYHAASLRCVIAIVVPVVLHGVAKHPLQVHHQLLVLDVLGRVLEFTVRDGVRLRIKVRHRRRHRSEARTRVSR